MQIPKEYLEEKNYDGTRIVVITNENAVALKEQLNAIQENELNPIIDSLQDEFNRMDAAQSAVNGKIKEIQEIRSTISEEDIVRFQELATIMNTVEPSEISAQDVEDYEFLNDKLGGRVDSMKALDAQIAEIKLSVKGDKEKYEVAKIQMDILDNKALVLKNKMIAIVREELKDQLGEFERALNFSLISNQLHVEVEDRIEELVKSIRSQKNA